MKVAATLLSLVLACMLSGCGTDSPAQNATGGVWQSQMLGGDGTSSGYSFITQFTVGGSGGLTVQKFQFLTSIDGGCFPVIGETPTGSLTNLNYNSALQLTSGNFSFTIGSDNNTLVLTSTSVTGTLSSTTNATLTDGIITGTWAVQGSSGCSAATGTFTMTQGTVTTTTTTTTTPGAAARSSENQNQSLR
jgi:hypothetical protein